MRTDLFRSAALGTAVLLAGPAARGDDTVLLGGAGSFARSGTVALMGRDSAYGDVSPVCWRLRALRWGYACAVPAYPAPVYVAPAYSAPVYSPPVAYPATPELAPPPAASSPPLAPPAELSIGGSTRSSIVLGYQGRFFGGSIVLPLRRRASEPAPQPAPERTPVPTPRPTDSYRYDGGPANPVPMPSPDPVPATEPVPTTVPALYRIAMARSQPRATTYLAYGELK